jgi:hypothetical protein
MFGFQQSPFDVLNNLDPFLAKAIASNRLAPPPNLGPIALTASDYGGDHSGSLFDTYSFFLAEYDQASRAFSKWALSRPALLPDGRRMSFKGLNDGMRSRALQPFMQAVADSLGTVITVAIDQRIPFVFSERGDSKRGKWFLGFRGQWKDKLIERLLRVTAFATFFQSRLTKADHHLWFADTDAITQGRRLHDFLNVSRVMADAHGLDPEQGRIFATPDHQEDLRGDARQLIEDFCSVPDLFAGVFAQVASILYGQGGHALPIFGEVDVGANISEVVHKFENDNSPPMKVGNVIDLLLKIPRRTHLLIVFWKSDVNAKSYQVHLLHFANPPKCDEEEKAGTCT